MYVRWGLINQLWDGDKTEVDQEGENIEHKQPFEEHEIGQNAGAELPPDLLHSALP